MILPKLVHSFESIVRRSTIHYPLPAIHWRQRRLGFTLIELLVAISIIAILVGAGTYAYSNAQQKARDSKRKNDLKTIQSALQLFYEDNGYFPTTVVFVPNTVQQSDQIPWVNSDNGAGVGQLIQNNYIKKLPVDPINQFTSVQSTNLVYNYYAPLSGDPGEALSYILCATNLENANDPEITFSILPNGNTCDYTFVNQ